MENIFVSLDQIKFYHGPGTMFTFLFSDRRKRSPILPVTKPVHDLHAALRVEHRAIISVWFLFLHRSVKVPMDSVQ